MDGISLTKIIKATRPVPIILITGFAQILETQDAFELGADEFLPKPFDRKDIEAAVTRCLKPAASVTVIDSREYCRLGIEEFTSGRQIQFNIFLKLGETKMAKISQKGEDLPRERVTHLRSKGIRHLYLRRQDFNRFVAFDPKINLGMADEAKQQRLALVEAAKAALPSFRTQVLDPIGLESAIDFTETALDLILDDAYLLDLLLRMHAHNKQIFHHGLAVCLYSVLAAHELGWNLPTNKFKIAMGAFLHDAGLVEMSSTFLDKPRSEWTADEVKMYENHPTFGVQLIKPIYCVPPEVLQIVGEHHENCVAQGFPNKLRKSSIQPFAKLLNLSNEFCNRLFFSHQKNALTPLEVLRQMESFEASKFDPQFFAALAQIFAPKRI